MRVSIPRLARLVPKATIPRQQIVEPLPKEVLAQPSLIETLMARRAEAGANYPANIRIEPPKDKRAFQHLRPARRDGFLKLLRER